MFPNVYLFNPDYDMAMANFTPYYKSPAEIMRMIADLSVLPWWFAEEGNCVKVENMALVSLLQKQLAYSCGGAGGGKIRNTRAAGGVPPSGGIARNARTQGKELDGFVFVPPLPRQ